MKNKILVIALVVFVGMVGFMSYVSNHNYAVQTERTIVAEYENLKNILGQYSLKVSESIQLPKMKANDLSKIVREAMSGRYGTSDASKPTMLWITENYPGKITDDLYKQVGQIIESGRNKFENSQTKLIDVKRSYETKLGYFWSGMWLGYAGFPKIDLDDYQIIMSKHAVDTFDTKIDKGLTL